MRSKVRGTYLRANSTQIRGFHSWEKTFVRLSIYYLLSGANSATEPHPSLRGNFILGVVHKASLHTTAILSVPFFSGKAGAWTQNHRKPVTSQVQPDLRDQLSELFKPGWVVNEAQGDQDVRRMQDSGIHSSSSRCVPRDLPLPQGRKAFWRGSLRCSGNRTILPVLVFQM